MPTKIKPPLALITGWTPGIQPQWSVTSVRTALLDHESGSFSSSAQLVEAMGRDARYTNAVSKRINSLIRRQFSVESGGRGGQRAAKALEENWYDILPESSLKSLLTWYRGLGFAVGELRWEPATPIWKCTLHVHHPQFMWYDYEIESYRMYAEDGEHVVTPGDGKWVVLEDGYRGWMHGAVRSLAIPFLVRSYAIRDWGRHSERHGMPLIKVKHPGVAEDTEIDGILDELRALANEVSVSLPQNVDGQGTGWDLDLLEAKANDWQGFVNLLDHCAREYDIRILGQNLSTEIDGGSRAAATVHDAAFDGIVDGDAELLATDLREQLVAPWTRVNFGGDTPPPWPRWERASSTNALELKRRAESIDMLGKAMSSIQTAGYRLTDPDDFARQFGIQIEEIPEDEKPQPVAPLPDEQPDDDDAQGGSGEENDGDDSKPAAS